MRTVCYQREIREKLEQSDPRSIVPLDQCHVDIISDRAAKEIIYKYEWLGTMGRTVHTCGLIGPTGQVIGALCFGWPGSPESRDICGKDFRDRAICLERGACAHYTHPHAPSFLVSRGTRLIHRLHGYDIFYAYSDEEAGEIGTIYQACNWLYIGQGVGRSKGRLREDFKTPEGPIVSSRTLRHRGLTKTEAIQKGWKVILRHPKHKYVYFEGSKSNRRTLKLKLRYPALPYPNRQERIERVAAP